MAMWLDSRGRSLLSETATPSFSKKESAALLCLRGSHSDDPCNDRRGPFQRAVTTVTAKTMNPGSFPDLCHALAGQRKFGMIDIRILPVVLFVGPSSPCRMKAPICVFPDFAVINLRTAHQNARQCAPDRLPKLIDLCAWPLIIDICRCRFVIFSCFCGDLRSAPKISGRRPPPNTWCTFLS